MDLFEYILETMNYNLYTEDYLYESIDIKKIGSNIKGYIIRFFSWLRKKITEAFEKLKSKFSKKGSSNDKKDLPKDDEILKPVDAGDLDDDVDEKKEHERQEDDEQPKKEHERQERIKREREESVKRSLNQIKKNLLKKFKKNVL